MISNKRKRQRVAKINSMLCRYWRGDDGNNLNVARKQNNENNNNINMKRAA